MSITGIVLAGRYRLEEQLASGGMGAVWRARDQLLERAVAVKLLHDTLADDPLAAERFKREALTAAQISHPHMANVYDYVEDAGRPGIVMELVPHETLAQRLARQGPLTPAEAIPICLAVLDALGAAHDAGIVHRDVKPGNILLTPTGGVKVTDFGIARALGETSLTQSGNIMGTAHYTAPEQVKGEPASPASDLYALGIVLYEMLTGLRPFEADSAVGVAMARLSEDPLPPSTHRPEIPSGLEAIVMRALEREPSRRFGSAREMADALARTGADVPGTGTDRLPVGAAGDATVALSAAALRPEPDAPSPLAEVVPPRWALRRIVGWVLPLLLVAGLAAWFFTAAMAPEIVTVPKLTGMALPEARAAVTELKLQATYRDSALPRDQVMSQSAAEGTELEEGSTVRVVVSRGNLVRVPSVVGMTLNEAEEALKDAKLVVGRVSRQQTGAERSGTVLAQDPARTSVEPGTAVALTVAVPPEKEEDRGKDEGNGDGNGNKGKGRDD